MEEEEASFMISDGRSVGSFRSDWEGLKGEAGVEYELATDGGGADDIVYESRGIIRKMRLRGL